MCSCGMSGCAGFKMETGVTDRVCDPLRTGGADRVWDPLRASGSGLGVFDSEVCNEEQWCWL